MPFEAVPRITTERRKKQHWHLARKTENPEQRRRMSQLIDQPELRHVLHPCSDQRNELSRDEKLKITVLQGAEARGHGRADRGAVTLQNVLPPLVGCRRSELVTMPRLATPCQREGIRISETI